MYKLELFTRVRSPYIWQTRERANAPDIVNRQLSAASERALASIVATNVRQMSDQIVRQMSDQILPSRSESLHSQIVKL
jgi:hypothetical protein